MAKLILTVTLEVPNDPEPGHPTRFIEAFKRIGRMLSDGSRAGEFDERYTYSQGGQPESDNATITFEVVRR